MGALLFPGTQALNGIRYHAVTFGCQMNKHDSERICGMLEAMGAVEVTTVDEADAVIYMTCCVREAAEVRLYGQIATMKNVPLREGTPLKKRIVAVGGCIAQRDREEIFREAPHVDVVFGTHNIGSLPALLVDAIEIHGRAIEVLESSDAFPTDFPSKPERAYSAWLPIMIGCNNFCTYCIVPYVRGREKSRRMEDIVDEAKTLIASGVREITLLGQNVNSYGRDLYGDPRFADLLYALDAIGIERLRFATSHPKDIDDRVIKAFGEIPSLMPYLHLPVQSGSDRVLKAMNRKYTAAQYLDEVDRLRAVRPDIALSTDIIVGFPGETEEDFLATYDIVERVGYQQVFSFIYSPREGTPAASMAQEATRDEIQDRFDRLVDIIQAKAFESNQSARGETLDVLFDGPSKRDAAMLSGTSRKNQTVHVPLPNGEAAADYVGKIGDVVIDEAKTWYLSGHFADGSSLR